MDFAQFITSHQEDFTAEASLWKNPESPHIRCQIASLKEQYQISVNNDQIAYEEQIFRSKSQSNIYKYIRDLKKTRSFPETHWNGRVATDDASKANLFNENLTSLFNAENTQDTVPSSFGILGFDIDRVKLRQELLLLNPRKSSGPDGIPPLLLRLTATSFEPSLYNIFRNIARVSDFPQSWKQASVVPVFKK